MSFAQKNRERLEEICYLYPERFVQNGKFDEKKNKVEWLTDQIAKIKPDEFNINIA